MGNDAEEELLAKLADGSIPHAYVRPRILPLMRRAA